MEFRTIVVAGASRGIGLAVAEHLQPRTKRLVTVSRTQAPVGEWIAADLSELNGVEKVTHTVGSDRLDALLYMGGTWETHAFTSKYSFENCSDADITKVIAVNLVAPIRLVKALLPALRRSDNPKIIFMGSLSGRDNFSGREVANSASKFGLRGVVHSLREELRSQQIGVTVINPGYVATPEVLADLAANNFFRGIHCVSHVVWRQPNQKVVPINGSSWQARFTASCLPFAIDSAPTRNFYYGYLRPFKRRSASALFISN